MDTIDRRFFLKIGFKLTALFTLSNPFKQFFDAQDKVWPTWEELMGYARWCPNVHNLQPHKIKVVSTTEALLYYDPARLLPIGDPNCIFVTVAMGIFIEYLSIAAAPYGTKIEIVEVFEPISINAKTYTPFAKLKLVPSIHDEALDRGFILKRRTSRLHYDGLQLKRPVLGQIKNQSNELGHDFFYSTDKKIIGFIVDLNQQTLFEDISSVANRKELDHLFRYSKDEAENKKDGLWAKCMGFPGLLMKSVFQQPERWTSFLKREILSNFYKSSFKGTSTICWFCGDFNETDDWLNAGKMLARNWLLITKEQAYIQPFGSLITNASAHERINKKLKKSNDDKKIWMVFRAGYSKEPAKSYRLTTDEIIIKL